MKKFLIILMAIILCSSFLCGCSSCSSSKEDGVEEQINATDITILNEDNTSPYKVVISSTATEWEQYALSELLTFYKQATGSVLPVITDTGLEFSEEDCYFSIGDTTIYRGSGVNADINDLGRDGYKLVRRGKTLIFIGGGGYGTIYSVYKFLEVSFGYCAYAFDEIAINKTSKLYLYDFNVTDKPDFDNRAGGYYVTYTNKEFATRLRTLTSYGTRLFQNGNLWGSWAHTHFQYMPKAQYYETHRDWYSEDGEQLCLSNIDMRNQLIENLKAKILAMPDSELFMIGQEDKATFCACSNCKAITEGQGIGNSGLMMQFINYVADAIKEWQKTVCPERNIQIGTFAYQRTQNAPVVQDENGKYVPINESVIARDNVFILIAPIYADWCSPINDKDHNLESYAMLEGWSACSNNLAVWGYCNNFDYNLEYFDNINTIATNYKVFSDLNVKYLFDESGGSVKQAFAFQSMMAFVHSQLMWDCEQNVEDLIDGFMKNYYKEAAEPMRNYFNLMRNYVTTRKVQLGEEKNSYYGTGIWLDSDEKSLLNSSFWRKSVLQQMINYLDEAYAKLDGANYFGEEKSSMLNRIDVEKLTPTMYLLELFASELNASEYLSMVDEFENKMIDLGITGIFRNESLAQTLKRWRSNFN